MYHVRAASPLVVGVCVGKWFCMAERECLPCLCGISRCKLITILRLSKNSNTLGDVMPCHGNEVCNVISSVSCVFISLVQPCKQLLGNGNC